MLRVVRIITRLNVGGPTFHVRHLARDLPRHGFETVVLHGSSGASEGNLARLLDEAGIRHERLPELGRNPAPWRDLRALAGIGRALARYRPDVVHTHLAKAGALGRLAARRARVRAVLHTFHGHVFEGYFPRPVSRAVVLAERGLARITHRLLVPGERMRRELLRYRIAPPHRVLAYPPCVDWKGCPGDPDDPHGARLEAGDDGLPRVGIVGRLVPVKGHAALFRALERLSRAGTAFRLLVAGDGPLGARLEALARRHGIGGSTRFLGLVTDRAALYRSLDLLVVSSRNEGVPLVALEAMRFGVPVVAFDVGGVGDAVEPDRTGILVPPGDTEALGRAVAALLTDSARRRRLGDAAREAARGRDPEATVRAVARIYRDVLAEPAGSGTARS